MNNYIKWDKKDIHGLNKFDIEVLYTEIDVNGIVLREIGFDNEGQVVHKYPSSAYKYGQYGIFDNQKIQLSDNKQAIPRNDFERGWEGK